MLDILVRYLKENGMAFRLASHPSPEPLPAAAHPVHPGAGMVPVSTRVVRVDGKPAIACFRAGENLDIAGLRNDVGARAVDEASPADLQAPGGGTVSEPVPPLGRLFGVPLFIDKSVVAAGAMMSFPAFSHHDFVELSYDDFMRVEEPRVASLSDAGELPPAERAA